MTINKDLSMEQRILEVAERLFLEKGFALTSTTEIAKEAGCNQALVHYYFRTKDNLFETIFIKKFESFFAGLDFIDEPGAPFETTLQRLVEAQFELVRRNPQLPFLVINELTTNPSRIESLKQRVGGLIAGMHSRLGSLLDAAVAAGRIRPVGLVDVVFDLLSLNVAVFLAAPIAKPVLGLDEAGYEAIIEARKREIVELIVRGLAPDGDRPRDSGGSR
jgi:TetR/AcrR family transcriptional regulator